MSEPVGVLSEVLSRRIARLAEHERLTVVDLAAEGVIVWDLVRDAAGTPDGRARVTVRWDELRDRPAVLRAVRTRPHVVVNTVPGDRRNAEALDWLRDAHPEAAAQTCDVRLHQVLRSAVEKDPLVRPYELVALRQTATGRLELMGVRLFPIGARRGDPPSDLTVRCASTDGCPTVFAVVAATRDRRFVPVSVRSIDLAPGRYELTAVLRRPGVVRFDGLPGEPAPEKRAWPELVARIPDHVEAPVAPAHLICLVEISGPAPQVTERLSRLRQVIICAAESTVAGPGCDLRVSLVSYGPHSFDRRVPEVPVAVLSWADTAERVLAELNRLETEPQRADAGGTDRDHSDAAQLECALAEVTRRLDAEPAGRDRTSVLTVGDRPAFPHRAASSRILPCPHRRDWEIELSTLLDRPGTTLMAICDRPADRVEPIWHRVGGDRAPAHLEAVDVRRLVESLGLAAPTGRCVPFPLIDTP